VSTAEAPPPTPFFLCESWMGVICTCMELCIVRFAPLTALVLLALFCFLCVHGTARPSNCPGVLPQGALATVAHSDPSRSYVSHTAMVCVDK
jgi:hypothetical protein